MAIISSNKLIDWTRISSLPGSTLQATKTKIMNKKVKQFIFKNEGFAAIIKQRPNLSRGGPLKKIHIKQNFPLHNHRETVKYWNKVGNIVKGSLNLLQCSCFNKHFKTKMTFESENNFKEVLIAHMDKKKSL